MSIAASHDAAAAALSNKKVLVADDNLVNLDIASETLLGAGAIVNAVASGEEAIALIEAGAYDLVILDLAMPRVDGLAVGHAIRNSAANAKTPILLFTACDAADAAPVAREIGAGATISKPVAVDDLLRNAATHVRR